MTKRTPSSAAAKTTSGRKPSKRCSSKWRTTATNWSSSPQAIRARWKRFSTRTPALKAVSPAFGISPHYSLEELLATLRYAARPRYCLAPAARPKLGGVLAARVREDCEGFGNARGVRNLFEETAARQANRLAALPPEKITKEALMCLTEDDLPPL